MLNSSLEDAFRWAALMLIFTMLIAAFYFVDNDAYVRFAKEDALIENLSFLFYFFSGVILILVGIQNKFPQSRGLLPSLLGIFFVIVAGEEISWGQRIFDFSTPASMQATNTQGEFNFHNLQAFDKHKGWLNQHTILNIFVLLNGVIIPIVYWLSPMIRGISGRLKFPIVPLVCVPIFVIALTFEQALNRISPHWAHTEVKELLFAMGFLLFAVSFYRGRNVICDPQNTRAEHAR